MEPIRPEAYYVYGHKRQLAAIGLALILFISALDATIVAVALPTIGQSFNKYQEAPWVITAYLLTYTAFLPIVSKLTDILGRKIVLVGSTIFFLVWSGACGGAQTMLQLIIFRALQGIGGSAIYSGVIVTFTTMVPPAKTAVYTPIIGATYALSSVAGPLLGGVIVEHLRWGWIFFVNLPIGTIGVALLMYSLRDPRSQPLTFKSFRSRIDWLGCFFLIVFSVLVAFALQIGGTSGFPWTGPAVLTSLGVAVVSLPAFIWAELRHNEPIVPLHLFRVRNMALIIIFSFGLGAGFFAVTVFLPQRMQIVSSASPVGAGVRMLPLLLTVGFLSSCAGISVRLIKGFRPQMWIASAAGAAGAGLLSTLTTTTSYAPQYGFETMIGFCFGVTVTISTLIVQYSSPRAHLASATGLQSFVRQLGGLVGIAISTALLNARVHDALMVIPSEALRAAIVQSPEGVLPKLPPQLQQIARAAYSAGFSQVFIGAAAYYALGALTTLALKHEIPAAFMLWTDKKTDIEMGPPKVSAVVLIGDDTESGKIPSHDPNELKHPVHVYDAEVVEEKIPGLA